MFSVVLSTEMETDVALFFTPDLTGVGTQTDGSALGPLYSARNEEHHLLRQAEEEASVHLGLYGKRQMELLLSHSSILEVSTTTRWQY